MNVKSWVSDGEEEGAKSRRPMKRYLNTRASKHLLKYSRT